MTLTFTYDLVLSPVITHSLSDSHSEEVTFPEITSLIPGEMFLRYIPKSKYNALNNVFLYQKVILLQFKSEKQVRLLYNVFF